MEQRFDQGLVANSPFPGQLSGPLNIRNWQPNGDVFRGYGQHNRTILLRPRDDPAAVNLVCRRRVGLAAHYALHSRRMIGQLEGGRGAVLVNRFERDPGARKARVLMAPSKR
jgi:hypothetical protein